MEQIVEVLDLHHLLRHIDEVRVVLEEPANERDPESLLAGGGQVMLAGSEVMETLDRADDRRKRRFRILEDLGEEIRPVFEDPVLEQVEDLRVVKITGRDPDRKSTRLNS